MGPEQTNSDGSRRRWTFCVGEEVGIRLRDRTARRPPAAASWTAFANDDCCQLSLEAVRSVAPPLGAAQLALDSGGLWKVFRKGSTYIFELPHLRAVVDFEADSGTVYRTADSPCWFDYPLDEVIFSKLLADRGSLIVHACGVSYQGRGLLFGGQSGVGKSTLASLFEGVAGAQVLSDDRVAVGMSVDSEIVRVSGTPWHGTARQAANRTVPLERMFFLRQGPDNQDTPLSHTEVAARLLSLSVIPYWHSQSAQRALDAAVRIAQLVHGMDLEFFPDPRAVQHVLDTLAHTESPQRVGPAELG